MADWYWAKPHVCPVCGKTFWVTCVADWAYKRFKPCYKHDPETIVMCSWSCLRKYDMEVETRKKA